MFSFYFYILADSTDWYWFNLIQFQLKDGPRHVPHYGLLLAEVAGLPSTVIETARSITSRITEKVTISIEQIPKLLIFHVGWNLCSLFSHFINVDQRFEIFKRMKSKCYKCAGRVNQKSFRVAVVRQQRKKLLFLNSHVRTFKIWSAET